MVVVVTCVKQSQNLGLGLSLEFDKMRCCLKVSWDYIFSKEIFILLDQHLINIVDISCVAWTCRASHNTPLWPLWPSGWWSAASTPPHLSASSRSPGPPPCKLSSQHRAKAHPEQKLLKVDNFVLTAYLRLFLGAKINASMLKTLSVRIEVRRKTKSPSALLSSQTSPTSIL